MSCKRTIELAAYSWPPSEIKTALRAVTIAILGPDPHIGWAPNSDTVDAYVEGYIAALSLTNARPEKYADEPWRKQGAEYHAKHAADHAAIAFKAVETFNNSATQEFINIEDVKGWISDLGKPEAVHAIVRLFFLLWSAKRGVR